MPAHASPNKQSELRSRKFVQAVGLRIQTVYTENVNKPL